MRSFDRSSVLEPLWLIKYWKKWSTTFRKKLYHPTKKKKFVWATYKKIKVHIRLRPTLKLTTQDHCSFCDGFPLENTGVKIEHFKPSSLYPDISYKWDNLFYCCVNCNENKNDRYSWALLKPDSSGYDFWNFFDFNFTTGIISPKPGITKRDFVRAKTTIDFYGLNKFGRPESRIDEIQDFSENPARAFNRFQYRFILDKL